MFLGLGAMKEDSWVWLLLLHIKGSLKLSSNYLDMLLLQVRVCLISSSWGKHGVFCKGFHGSGIEGGRSMWHGLGGFSRLLFV